MTRRLFLFLLITLHALFFTWALYQGSYMIPDSFDYRYQAQNIRQHGAFYAWNWEEPVKMDYFTKRTPGYGFVLAALNAKEWLLLLLQNLLSILLFLLLHNQLVRRGLSVNKAGILLLLALLFQSNQLIYANTLISEVIFQLLVFCGFLALLSELEKPRASLLYAGSALFALALLVKPVLIFWSLPLALWIIGRCVFTGNRKALPSILLMPLVVFIWSYRNEQLTGYFHYTAISTVNLKDYNTRLLLESMHGPEKADSVITGINRMADGMADYGQRCHFIQDTCKEILKSDWKGYLKIHAKGMVAMLMDPGRFDAVNFLALPDSDGGLMYLLARGDVKGILQVISKQEAPVTVFFFLNFLGSVVLLILALVGLWKWRKDYLAVLLIILLAGYFLALTGPVGTARYKSALLPLLLLLAGRVWMKSPETKKETVRS